MATDSNTLSIDTEGANNLSPRHRNSDEGYLYLLQEMSNDETPTGFYKVGFTEDPVARRNKLQTGNPRKLKFRMVGLVTDKREGERELKDFLSQYHVEGGGTEWYQCTYTQIANIFSSVCMINKVILVDTDSEVQTATDSLDDSDF